MLYAIPIGIAVSLYFFADDLSDKFLLIALQDEEATCGEFQDAPSEVQSEFLQGGDDGAEMDGTMTVSPAALESCVHEAVKACARDDSLHRITRACAAPPGEEEPPETGAASEG